MIRVVTMLPVTTPDIMIEATPRKRLDIVLGGIEYTIKAPKAGLALAMASAAVKADQDPGPMLAVLDRWLAQAFGKDGVVAVRARLDDDDDDLDLTDLLSLMEKVTVAVTGNPTSSPSDSPAQPSTTGKTSTGGPPPKA